MNSGRFHCVQGSGDSLWFDEVRSLQEAFRSGLVSSDAIVFDQADSRWYLLADHSATLGLDAPPPRPMRPTPRSRNPSVAPKERDQTATPVRTRDATGVPQADRSSRVRWKPIILLGAVVGLVALISIADNSDRSSPPASAARGATWVASRVPGRGTLSGLLTNYGTAAVHGVPSTGSISLVFDSSDASHGEIVIGLPLAGSGRAEFAYWADTLIAVSTSTTGDSIAWIAARAEGRLAGSYVVFGGRFSGQGGRWWVSVEGGVSSMLNQLHSRPDSAIVQNLKKAVEGFEAFPLMLSKDSPR